MSEKERESEVIDIQEEKGGERKRGTQGEG